MLRARRRSPLRGLHDGCPPVSDRTPRRGSAARELALPGSAAAFEAPLLLGSAFGRRDRLEPLVRNRLAALDREPVRTRVDAGLRALHCGELVQEPLAKAGLELVFIELTALVAEMLVDGRKLAVVPARLLGERPFDPLPLSAKKLACLLGVHEVTLPTRVYRSALDEHRLVLASLQASPRDELDLGLDDEHAPQSLADRLRQLVIRRRVLAELDRDRQRRLLLHAWIPRPDEDVAADHRRERVHDLAHSRRKDVHSADDEHVVVAPEAPDARTRPPAAARACPKLDVIAGPEAEERRRAVLQVAQDELALRAVGDGEGVAALRVDELCMHEAARAEVHPVLLFALAPERRADVSDAHRLRDLRTPAVFQPGSESRFPAPWLAGHEHT